MGLSAGMPLRVHVCRDIIASVLRPNGHASKSYHVFVTSIILWTAVGMASLPLSLKKAIGLTSAICASLIIYILPGTVELMRLQIQGFNVSSGTMASFSVLFGLAVFFLGPAAILQGSAHEG